MCVCAQIAAGFGHMLCAQQERIDMNKDQVKGAAKDIAGKIQEQAGKLVGSKKLQIKGLSKQISGKAQKGAGDIKQAVENITKS
jgi:uncharacterized protein YjbJ (UPF0337 family)